MRLQVLDDGAERMVEFISLREAEYRFQAIPQRPRCVGLDRRGDVAIAIFFRIRAAAAIAEREEFAAADLFAAGERARDEQDSAADDCSDLHLRVFRDVVGIILSQATVTHAEVYQFPTPESTRR